MTNPAALIKPFQKVGLRDIPQVGGKNASLGEMIRTLSKAGVRVPGGFAVTSAAYWDFLGHNHLEKVLRRLTDDLHPPQGGIGLFRIVKKGGAHENRRLQRQTL